MSIGAVENRGLLASYINEVFVEKQQKKEECCRKVSRIFLQFLALGLGYASGIVYYFASDKYPDKTVADISKVGSFLAFGSFAGFDSLLSVEKAFSQSSQTEKALHHHYIPRAIRIANVSLAVILGFYSQYPLVDVALTFSDELWIGVLTSVIVLLGTAAPPGVSMLEGLNQLESFVVNGCQRISNDPAVQTLKKAKEILISNATQNFHWGIKSLSGHREIELFGEYHLQQRKIPQLAKKIFSYHWVCEQKNRTHTFHHIATPLIHLFFGVYALICYGLLAGSLAADATKKWTSNESLIGLFVTLSVIPWIMKLLKLPGNAVNQLLYQFTDLLCIPRDKDFVDFYFPVITKGLHLLGGGISLMSYGAIEAILNEIFDAKTKMGQFYTVGSTITIVSFFFIALTRLGKKGIEKLCTTNCEEEELQKAKAFKDHTERFLGTLNELSLKDLKDFLSSLNDQEINEIFQQSMWPQDLAKLKEILPLLQEKV